MFSEKKDNAILAFQAFLRVLQAPVTASTAGQTLMRHPHYPSLLAVTDCLHQWHIEYATARILPDQLTSLTTPFFTQVSQDGGLFTVVSSVSETGVQWLHTQNGWQQDTVADFKAKWVPVVLLAEVSARSGEVDFRRNRQQERLANARTIFVWIALSISLLLTGSLFFNSFTGTMPWQWTSYWLTKLVGAGLSIYLLGHTVDRHHWSPALCQFHQTVDCNAVLTSRAATLWGWLSWSEIGFVYFSGSTLALLMTPESSVVQTVLWGLGLAALPYTLFSVYYQAWVVKKWCTVCLLVQVLLLLDGGLLLAVGPVSRWNPIEIPGLVLAYLVPALSWVLAKPLLKRAQLQPATQHGLTRLRANPLVFASLLHSQKPVFPLPGDVDPIRLGDPLADYSITLVLNPYCAPCGRMFADLEELLGLYPFINYRCLFASPTREQDPAGQFVRHLYTLPAPERITALRQWYGQKSKDIEAWAASFPIADPSPYARHQAQLQSQWCIGAGIRSTPAILIGGYLVPVTYQLTDIPLLLKYGPPPQPDTNKSPRVQRPTEYQS